MPFHAWTPDAYDGAPTAVTAFISVAPKIAALGLLLRLLAVSFEPYAVDLEILAWCIWRQSRSLSGNVVAVAQTNVKRMLAYSSIAHSGYMLAGLVATQSQVGGGLRLRRNPYIALLRGRLCAHEYGSVCGRDAGRALPLGGRPGGIPRPGAKSSPGLALAMAVFMLSLIGVPPTAGFFGKLLIIDVLVDGGRRVAGDSAGTGGSGFRVLLPAGRGQHVYARVRTRMRRPQLRRLTRSGRSLPTTAFGTIGVGIWSGWLLELANAGSVPAAALTD